MSHHTLAEKTFNGSLLPAEQIPNLDSEYSLFLFYTCRFICHFSLAWIPHSSLTWSLPMSWTRLAFGICCPCFCSCFHSVFPNYTSPVEIWLISLRPSNIFKSPALIPHPGILSLSSEGLQLYRNYSGGVVYCNIQFKELLDCKLLQDGDELFHLLILRMPCCQSLNMLLLNNYSLTELTNEWLINPNKRDNEWRFHSRKYFYNVLENTLINPGCHSKITKTEWPAQQTFVSHGSGGCGVLAQGASRFAFWRGGGPHMVEGQREGTRVFLPFVIRTLIPAWGRAPLDFI